jgi:hypothetical protein
MEKLQSLTAGQLQELDLLITRAQEKGRTLRDLVKYTEDTDGLADAHHPLYYDFSERDRQLIAQIRDLFSQISATVPLQRLIEMRAQAVQTLKQRG